MCSAESYVGSRHGRQQWRISISSIKTKLALTAIGIAMVATPAFAQRPHRQAQSQDYYATQDVPHYPNGAKKSGSANSVDSGAMFNTENY